MLAACALRCGWPSPRVHFVTPRPVSANEVHCLGAVCGLPGVKEAFAHNYHHLRLALEALPC